MRFALLIDNSFVIIILNVSNYCSDVDTILFFKE